LVHFGSLHVLLTQTHHTDVLLKKMIDHAQVLIKPWNDEKQAPPDPSFVLAFPDEVLSGANLYAVQKTFEGPFSFDVYFQSGSAKKKLDGKHALSLILLNILTRHQPTWFLLD
jgi:hypothetical protein